MNRISVLIVEDSRAQRELVAALCREIGVGEVVCAENGRVALNIIDSREHEFDVLVCDLEMPDMDGVELISRLSQGPHNSALIIVSGRELSLISAVELMAKSQGLWVLGALQKPMEPSRFELLLNKYCALREQLQFQQKSTMYPVSVTELVSILSAEKPGVVLHFQPKIDLSKDELEGVEVLVRLKRQDGSLIYPNDFIPLCEKNGLIDELTYEVIRQTLDQAACWQEIGLKPKMSVNLSAVSFDNGEFAERLLALFQGHKVDPKSMVLEVTETSVIKDIGKALVILARLRLIGCGLSIDDYGTGYSSVRQLAEIPFTELKMDRCLIDGIAGKPHLQVIFDSTLAMCKKMGLQLVAEGIEQQEDWQYLVEHGCPVAQGFYCARPMTGSDLTRWWLNKCHADRLDSNQAG